MVWDTWDKIIGLTGGLGPKNKNSREMVPRELKASSNKSVRLDYQATGQARLRR